MATEKDKDFSSKVIDRRVVERYMKKGVVDEKDFALEGGRTASVGAMLERREAWPWLAAAVLALLCLEWAMYHRRWI